MDRLLSVLEDEVKRSVESIGISGILYATTLKTLKRDVGNAIIIAFNGNAFKNETFI